MVHLIDAKIAVDAKQRRAQEGRQEARSQAPYKLHPSVFHILEAPELESTASGPCAEFGQIVLGSAHWDNNNRPEHSF
jgi:hypothetical protein